jgi:hypothetical protein
MLNRPYFSSCGSQGDWQDSDGVAVSDPLLGLHEVEQTIWRELHSLPRVHFSSLTVRRIGGDGVCLQGVMETDDQEAPDFDCVVKRVAGVGNVVNQLLVRETADSVRLPR